MTDFAVWETRNNAFLGAALAWLRLSLELRARAGSDARPAPLPPRAEPGAPARRRGFFRHSHMFVPAAEPDREAPAQLPPPREPDGALLIAAETALARARAAEPAPALVALAHRLGLSRFEQDVLLLCLAPDLDPGIAGLIAAAQASASPHPTFALALGLFDAPAWEALSPERPLRYWRLIEITQPGASGLTVSALRADERILNHAKGLAYVDDRLAPLLTPLSQTPAETLPPSQRKAATAAADLLARAAAGRAATVLLAGPDREAKARVAAAAASLLGLRAFRLDAEDLPAHPGEIETLARLWDRETLLGPNLLLLDAHELDGAGGGSGGDSPAVRLSRFLARSGAPRCLAARDGAPAGAGPAPSVEVARPLPAEQRDLWRAALGDEDAPGADDIPALLSSQFDMDQDVIEAVAAERAGTPPEALSTRLWQAARQRNRPAMDRLAAKIDAKARWDDIVLPENAARLLDRIVAQVRLRARVYDEGGFRARMNRGLGVSALFAGESGAGKTMAAEVIANALDLDLYRVDLSAVVNKYIGETEKNLRRVFDAAESGGTILFFDEGDSLFGKRSEVKDSHDRYANIEVNYLLQRIETYRGLAIIATNMKAALDQAFLRRLRFVVDFPFPGEAERRCIWARAFPPETATEGLDLARLARFTLTGGSIHNVALNAAFLAAEAGRPVMTPDVLEAVRTELRKLERPINEAEFRVVTAVEGTR